MIIGIDVGGTHADGVLLESSQVVKKKKIPVDDRHLQNSIIALLDELLPNDGRRLQRIQLSTTLCTNAIVKNELAPVGMFIQAGPGMNPSFLSCGRHTCFLSGALDHRGKELRATPAEEIKVAAAEMERAGLDSIGIVTKFSHRNNSHELAIEKQLPGLFTHISLGHRVSGLPNFPRRVYTTWLNSGLMQRFTAFKSALEESMANLDINCPVYILKADGGTIPFGPACEFPCLAIHSGPSASVMGGLALQPQTTDTVLLDIGGTTTDIGLFAAGLPLLDPYGATVAGRPTLIRALKTTSIGLGGDSRVELRDGSLIIGPGSTGASMALGGKTPTPTDAMVVLGCLDIGSAQQAHEAMRMLAPAEPEAETAQKLLDTFCTAIIEATETMIEELFQRPVYTVADFLHRERIAPEQLVVMGGPAAAMQGILAESFGLPCIVPDDYEVANAIGAARARLTLQASLYADSGRGMMSIPECSLQEPVRRGFTMIEAEARLDHALREMAAGMGITRIPPVDFCERLEMNTVQGFATTGKIINLKAQFRPGLASEEL